MQNELNMTYLILLGQQLKALRKIQFPDDTKSTFARRLGVNRNTYSQMEKGSLSVTLGKYYDAAKLLGIESRFESLFEAPEEKRDLFAELQQ